MIEALENGYRLPIGLGSQLCEWRQDHPDLVAIFKRVPNRVYWVNDQIMHPFKLQEGKSTPLGVFAHSMLSDYQTNGFKSVGFELGRTHGRAALVGRMLFGDRDGRVFRDVDLKGCGYLASSDPFDEPILSQIHFVIDPDAFGLLSLDEALADVSNSEQLLAEGIRTYRTIAIIVANSYISDGRKHSIPYLERGKTALQLRAYGTRARVMEINASNPASPLLVTDAIALVSAEISQSLSVSDYLEWYCQTLGTNLGKLHKTGWRHLNLSTQNMTLDCRIVDWDDLCELRGLWGVDLMGVRSHLNGFIEGVESLDYLWVSRTRSYLKAFQEAYDKAFTDADRNRLEANPDAYPRLPL